MNFIPKKTAKQETASVKPKKKYIFFKNMGNVVGDAMRKAGNKFFKSTGSTGKNDSTSLFIQKPEPEPPLPFRPDRDTTRLSDINSGAIIIAENLPQPGLLCITSWNETEFYKAIYDIVENTDSNVKSGYVYFKISDKKYYLSEENYLEFVTKIYGKYFNIYFTSHLSEHCRYRLRESILDATRYTDRGLMTNDFNETFFWKKSNGWGFRCYSQSNEFLRLHKHMLYVNKDRWLTSLGYK